MAEAAKQFGISVPAKVHAAVSKRAAEKGLSPTAYARLLFEAGFSARIGQERGEPASDAELDAQVTLVFACAGHGDVAAISKATGVRPRLVESILKAWRLNGRQGSTA